ncbi:MAG TPA: CinA family protein [Candidatus Margulisiibacteriota bacterium]|nr:CinA family protein [Candidatus Margulisiibacteriota bacterium]
MEHIVNQIHKSLIKNKKTLAVGESCSGGLLSHLLTSIAGSSGFFLLGVVAYSNAAKTKILKVPPSVIIRYGVVSKRVAAYMAKNIRIIAGADFGIGITGIAGPGGFTPGKPVGTVFIAAASRKKVICRKFTFKGKRAYVQRESALKSLQLLKELF